MDKETKYALIIILLFLVSLTGAWILFSSLQSYALIENEAYKIGGPAAGFVIIFTMLWQAYAKMFAKVPSKEILYQGVRRLISTPTRYTFEGKQEMTKQSKKLMKNAEKSIQFFGGDLSWITEHSEILRENVSKGVCIQVLCIARLEANKHINEAKELGIEVRTYPKGFIPNLTGQIVDDMWILSITKSPISLDINKYNGQSGTDSLYNYKAELYNKTNDPLLFDSMIFLFDVMWTAHKALSKRSYQLVDLGEIIKKLRKVPQYSSAKISFEEVWLTETQPLRNAVDIPRLSKVKELADELHVSRLSLTAPISVIDGTNKMLIFPPIVERYKEKFYVIDGFHRLYYLWRSNVKAAKVIVIDNVTDPLPATPLSWDTVGINFERSSSRLERYNNLQSQYWRDLSFADVIHG